MLSRIDPASIDLTLKEAVAEALIGRLYNAVSGQGDLGNIVVENRPSRKFVSGFLEPAYVATRGLENVDETANPIHIVTCGIDFQVGSENLCVVRAEPNFAIYVRVLPTEDDLKKHKIHLELTSEAKTRLRQALRAAVSEFWEANRDLRDEDRSKFYDHLSQIRRATANAVFADYGVSLDDLEIDSSENEEPSEEELVASESLKDGESIETQDEAIGETVVERELNFVTYPGSKAKIPENLVKAVRPVQKWLRIDLDSLPTLSFDASADSQDIIELASAASDQINMTVSERLAAWLADDNLETGGKLWAYPKNLSLTPEHIRHWSKTLSDIRAKYHESGRPDSFALPRIDVAWNIDVRQAPGIPTLRFVHVALENVNDQQPAHREEREESIFQVAIGVNLPSNVHVDLRLDRVKPSYRYNQYLNYPALGFNAGVERTRSHESIQLNTTWIPIYRQPRIQPIDYKDVDVRFDRLATLDGVQALSSLPNRFSKWIKQVRDSIDPIKGAINAEEEVRERERFNRDIRAWTREKDKIDHGIQLLHESAKTFDKSPESAKAIPIRAWMYMNETMSIVGSRSGYHSWRLFQVAFILANLSGFVSRMKEYEGQYEPVWDEDVALLYFATGGGKSEAFFGLLVFLLFLDRMRGKKVGVSAMLRYPLRLLTVQQAQRLARILATAEEVRWKHGIDGSAFAIGFWVGGANTPNRRSQITKRQVPTYSSPTEPDEQALKQTSDYVFALENWNKLPKCPFCEQPTALRRYRKLHDAIGHACTSDDCPWNTKHGETMAQPLPFYIVDDDIYDFAPSVLLGTIDKLALIGHSDTTIRRVFGMFGLAQFRDQQSGRLIVCNSPLDLRDYSQPDHVRQLYPMFKNGERQFLDPFPALIIQDETHLLEESLGTFSGIFQTLLEKVFRQLSENERVAQVAATDKEGNVRLPKIVAASATVMDPERQSEALYQRGVVQFPYPGPSIYESFYSAPVEPHKSDKPRVDLEDVEMRAHRARLYASLLTNGRPHTSTSVELLGHFHYVITDALLGLNSGDHSEVQRIRKALEASVLHSDLSSHYCDSLAAAKIEEIATLLDLHRISLTYVTNKKGGDQIMAAESDTAARIHEEAGVRFDGLHTELISGSVGSGEIEAVIRRAEHRPIPGEPLQDILEDGLVRSVVATSAISHGVDVNELNSMFFAGMPSDTAEYIQASSRIGRTHVGFSMLIPTPQRRRDRYILEVNDIYHRFLERMIRPAAVDRWAESALLRALPSLFLTYLIASLELRLLLDEQDAEKHFAGDFGRLQTVHRYMNNVGMKRFTDDVSEFIRDAVGLNHPRFGPSAVEQIGDILEEAIKNELIQEISAHVDELESIRSLYDFLDRESPNQKKSPMTSLRDVDPAGSIRYNIGSSKVDSDAAYEIIRTIRSARSGGMKNA